MRVPTHIMEYSGDMAATLDDGAGPVQFIGPLRVLDGTENWCLALYPLPGGKDYQDVAGSPTAEYLEAAGSAAAMTIEIRKPGGHQWGAESVRYVIGHPHEDGPHRDVAITLPDTTEMVSGPEVFEAEEAAQLFISYDKTGDIPRGYTLRPVEGYTADGELINLRELD